ncbi:ABC transporter ATP-binding protein [Brevundimonas sp. Bb-A]|jgi:capsular polysaccharide transport system ATP-binding protein|uniref:ABC transporter ATP-binding protein n=1 Tax=Brevundimonas sp. Bb-A TaxID=2560058 RepID=UPI00128EF58F|nr:ATP-binding cassette domain-containing protein [Brevundimonas sp. Bb-A]QFU30849.1 Polysialic acid transport ATP-binding protein KpsT [Brevundimonas sp. Bb-A]
MTQPEQPQIGLRVENLGMRYRTAKTATFNSLHFDVERNGRLAILGRNGQGKSTLIRLLGGILPPTSGRIRWFMKQSWPIGFGGGFQGSLSGLDNIRFLARLYDRDFSTTYALVDEFAELGRSLREPVKYYSSGMRARLAFGLSLAIEFDCYLIDELVAVGDSRFQDKCRVELFERRRDRAFMMASHDMGLIAQHCEKAIIVESGVARQFDDIEEAIDVYKWLRAS